ncbi:hypothetical protein ABZ897_11365 [Nonomuraea sp. NPDC046802]|uniref:hypothetical protein n=1 Tax=Nonomuraea sp. NPDC046802 TaxID=3154919 RepID=UPI0033E59EE5
MTVPDLREVLRERAEAPSPANPYRHDQVRARVRRTRLRRHMTAGATAAVAAVAAVVVLIPGTSEPREITAATDQKGGETTAAVELPERFTSGDGTDYRRVAALSMNSNGPKKVSVEVPVSGRPLDVAGRCLGEPGDYSPKITVNGRSNLRPSFSPCLNMGTTESHPLIVPKGATRVTVEFDLSSVGCLRKEKDGLCLPEPREADWSLAVYEWTPPARRVEPEPVKAFPERVGDMRRIANSTGLSDKEHEFTLTVTSSSGKIGIDQLCTGDLAQRLWFRYEINGGDKPVTGSCGVWKKGPYPMAKADFSIGVPKGKPVRITGRMGLWGDSTNRPVRWSVGVFSK